jgi:glycosyltransferase involved in cell wall biosynthesis
MGVHHQPKLSNELITNLKDELKLTAPRHLLFLGRLVSRKGVHDLIQAFAKIVSTHQDCDLIIAGDGQDRAHLEKLASKDPFTKGRIHFLGHIAGQKKQGILQLADILCIPSVNEGDHSEGLPVTFMEGIAQGKIVIASDVSGAQEYIKDSQNGFLFTQKNVAELETKIRTALTLDPAMSSKITSAAQQLSNEFTWDKIAARHLDFFSSNLPSTRNKA